MTSVLGLILYFNLFPVKTDILTSLSRSYFDDKISLVYSHFEQKVSAQVVLLLDGKDLDLLIGKAKRLQSHLKKTNLFLTLNDSQENYKELNTFYFSHRDLLLTDQQQTSILKGAFSDLEEVALQKIYSPFFSGSYKLKDDPLLLSDSFFDSKTPPLDLIPYQGFSITKDSPPKLVMVASIESDNAGKVYELLKNTQLDFPDLYFSSLSFYAHKAQVQAQRESTLFSTLSLLCILFIFWFYFRTLRHLLIAVTLLLLCCTFGLYVTSALFGSLFLMTLLLGISILGIMADYFIHYFVKEYNSGLASGKEAFNSISRPLKYSLLTSIAGYILFVLAPLPILKQFSVFTTITLLVAYFSVKFILPKFYLQTRDKPFKGFLFNERLCEILGFKKIAIFSFILICFLGAISYQKTAIIDYDIRNLSTPDKHLRLNEEKIKKVLNVKFDFQQFIARGKTPQEVLENENKLKEILKRLDANLQFVSDWVPTLEKQKMSQKLYGDLPNYLNPNSQFFTPADFIKRFPNIDISKFWIGDISGEFFSIVPIYSQLPGQDYSNLNTASWVYMNKVLFINHDLESFIKWLIIGGVVFIFLFGIFISIKMGLGHLLSLIMPAGLGIIISLLACLIIFGSLNLFHFLGCILILGLGLDYSFFYLFNRSGQELTALAIEISTLTTLASFGILALSSTNAVSAFGTTVLFGIIICWLVTPLSQVKAYDE